MVTPADMPSTVYANLSPTPEAIDRALRWLAYGRELALEQGAPSSQRAIWSLIEEAIHVIDKTPDQERRWLSSGARSGGWNMVGMSANEALAIERLRVMSAMKPFDGSTGTKPQSSEIDRAYDVMDWLRYCNTYKQPKRLTKAAIALARGGETEVVYRIFCPTGRRHDRRIADEIRCLAVGYIIHGLRRDFGIVGVGDGLFIREQHAAIAS